MKALIPFLTIAAAVAVGSAAGPAFAAADPARVAAGQKHFQYWCAPCHAGGAGENGRLLPGTASLTVKYKDVKTGVLEDRDDLVPALTTFVIRNGIEGMPSFRKTEISDQDMNDIAAYLARNIK